MRDDPKQQRRMDELREDERLGAALRRAQDAEDRLAALAQSDAEPNPAGVYGTAQSPTMRDLKPPRPDVSGLIEAAEWLKNKADGLAHRGQGDTAADLHGYAKLLLARASEIGEYRARAADRSKE